MPHFLSLFVRMRSIHFQTLPLRARQSNYFLINLFPVNECVLLDYLIACPLCVLNMSSVQPVPESTQPIFTLREDRVAAVTPTWRQWYEDRETDEWIMSVGSVMDQGWNEQYGD